MPLAVWWVQGWIRPLRRMVTATLHLGMDAEMHELDIKRDDEIGMLAQSFNMMALNLADIQQALEASQKQTAVREAPRKPVPDALWDRPKQGFTLPFDPWLRSGAVSLDMPELPGLRRDAMERSIAAFRNGTLHWSRVWNLVVLREFLEPRVLA